MHDYEYKVVFSTGEEEIVTCGSEPEARILAQAAQIRKGNRWDIRRVSFRDQTAPSGCSWLNT